MRLCSKSLVFLSLSLIFTNVTFAQNPNLPPEIQINVQTLRRLPMTTVLPVNRLCRNAMINSLVVDKVKGFDKKTNFCRVTIARVPKQLKTTLNQLKDIHIKISKFVGVTATSLLRRGFPIILKGNDGGFLASFYGSSGPIPGITIGVFPNWKNGLINSGVYAHEFTHKMVDGNLKSLKALQLVSGEYLLQEGIADELAITLLGTLSTDVDQLPACLSETRTFGRESSFDQPRGEFDGNVSTRRILNCCRDVEEQLASNKNAARLCNLFNSFVTKKPLPAYDIRSFEPEVGAGALLEFDADPSATYDTHELGRPIVSFFQDLRRGYGLTGSPYFQMLAPNTDASQFSRTFTCSFHSQPSSLTDEVSEVYMSTVFKKIRSMFIPLDGAQKFDELWALHAIDKGIAFGDKVIEDMQTMRAKNDLYNLMQNNTDEVLNRKNRCYNKNFEVYYDNKDCDVSCVVR